MLAITRNQDFHGIVGMESSVEFEGVKICIGDVVHVGEGSNNSEFTNTVVVLGNKVVVMGLGATSLSKLNIINIVQSHKVLKAGDRLGEGYFDVEEFIK